MGGVQLTGCIPRNEGEGAQVLRLGVASKKGYGEFQS